MRSNNGLKSMPYRITEGEMELVKVRSSAAIARAAAAKTKRRAVGWGVSLATAMGALLLFVTVGRFAQPANYDVFVEQLADVPIEVLYDMSVDAVEYEEDINLL